MRQQTLDRTFAPDPSQPQGKLTVEKPNLGQIRALSRLLLRLDFLQHYPLQQPLGSGPHHNQQHFLQSNLRPQHSLQRPQGKDSLGLTCKKQKYSGNPQHE